MRSIILLDTKIDKEEALDLFNDHADFYEKHTGLRPSFIVQRKDFSEVPTVPDSDGDLKPTRSYRHGIAKGIHKNYKDYGTDNIIMMVHDDNFVFRGVWGTAWSYVHFKYNFLLCRWDKRNSANTWNTFFHEGEHPADTLINKELGIEIDPLIASHFGYKSFDYDRDYVHGNHPDFKYIGRRTYQRDGRMLEFLAPYLRRAYAIREEKHEKEMQGMMRQIISLLTEKVSLLSRLLR